MPRDNISYGWDSGKCLTFRNSNGWSGKAEPPKANEKSESTSLCEKDFKKQLAELNPSASFSVEMPFNGNGNLYQVRTEACGEIFYGRATTEEEAMEKCCRKAIKFILQRNAASQATVNSIIPAKSNRTSAPQKFKEKPAEHGYQSKTRSYAESDVINARSRKDQLYVRPSASERRHERENELRGGNLSGVFECLDGWTRGRSNGTKKTNNNNVVYKESTPKSSHQRRQRGGNQERPERDNDHVELRKNRSSKNRPISASSDETALTASVTSPDLMDDDRSVTDSIMIDWKYKHIPIKNAVMMLNEMFPPPLAPQYKVTSQTGPPNNPTFTMVCCIKDETFTGEGKSKKEAKLACSQKAIEAICGTKVSDVRVVPEKSNPRANCDLDDWMELEGKNPVSILNELYPGIQYQLVSTSGPSHAPLFIIKASLNDVAFEGSGKSKKDAKLNASKALLVHLHKVGFNPLTGVMMSTQQDNRDIAAGHSLADRIGQLVMTKYQALFGSTTYSKRRVMAGVVMTRNWGDGEDIDLKDDDSAEVICVSSGTKCINGEQLSLEGCVVNDCHAEIVTRRCMMLYFYKQLQKLTNNDDSIFEYGEGGMAVLKEGIDFHLFITTSPCGDARIFSLHETTSTNTTTNNNTAPCVVQELEKSSSMPCFLGAGGDTSEDLISFDIKSEPDLLMAVKDSNEESGIFSDEMTPEKSTTLSGDTSDICREDDEDCKKINEEDIGEEGSIQAPSINGEKDDSTNGEKKPKERRPPTDSSKGMLRSKIECGMGTVPIKQALTIQTWDGIMSGDRLLTMACSDKLLRWNVIGFQGALLTLFMRPIYLKSITVGSKFHPGHMKRALYERIFDHVSDLPEGYQFNVPLLFATTSPETRQATKAHDYSVNWIVDQGQPEIVNGSSGKTINDNVSRLCKRSLFEEFLSVSTKMKLPINLESPVRYSEVKQKAEDYQRAKNKVYSALVSAGCGHWVEKPIEQDQFSL